MVVAFHPDLLLSIASQQQSPAVQVKRRIANRESARRVQQRRKEIIEDLQIKVGAF